MRRYFAVWQVLLGKLVVCLIISVQAHSAWAYPPQAPALTAAQRARLQERDRLARQADALKRQGRTDEAIRAAESMLAINRDVLGKNSTPAINAITLLAEWNRDRQDWRAARRYQREALDLLTRKYGKDDEDVTVARWMLERIEAESRMSAAQRHRLAEADAIEQRGQGLLNRGRYDEAVPLFRQAQLSLIREYRRRHSGNATSRTAASPEAGAGNDAAQLPPFFWAGFVLSGDWR